jgi:ABC-type multidrug transport system fused ATPase/permease subunit
LNLTTGVRREKSGCCIPVTKLETRQLSVRYGERTVLRDVSLPIHKCCATAIMGPSGCGKSSFLMALNRLTDLIPGASVTGEVLLDGDDLLAADVNVTGVRRRIGMIFQKPNPFPLSIERNLTLALEQAYRFGEKPVTPELVATVMAPDMEALEPTLARQGYNVRALDELLNTRPAEIRAFLQSRLPPGRTEELKQQLLGTGIPL